MIRSVVRGCEKSIWRNSSHHAGGGIPQDALVHERKSWAGTVGSAALRIADHWLLAFPLRRDASSLRDAGVWTNDPNDYGPDWQKIRLAVRKRDQFKCQVCGAVETRREHDVHHKTPFRAFIQNGVINREQANRLENLTTLCPSCHHKVEQNVRIRSGLGGLGICTRKPRAIVLDVRCARPRSLSLSPPGLRSMVCRLLFL
jgi:hypothetical protein